MPPARPDAALLVLALLGVGCAPIPIHGNDDTDADTDATSCQLLVTPPRLAFDIAASDAPSEPQTITLKSQCPARELTVYNLTKILGDRVDGVPVFRVTDQSLELFVALSDGDSVQVPVVFDPPRGGHFEARIPLGVSPIDSPGDIELVGDASGPAPVLSATQADDTLQWCDTPVDVRLDNEGPDVLVVRGLELADEPDCDSFELTEDVVGAEVDNGAKLDLPVRFRPVKPGPHACPLELVTDVASPARVTLRGDGLRNAVAEERFNVSDGSGANVLLLFDDAAPDINDARTRLSDGLPTLLDRLREQEVDFRITAASTADACTVGPFTYGSAANSDEDVLGVLRDNLFDDGGTTWAHRPLELMSEVAARAGGTCFTGWYEDHEPLHTIIVSTRDDASGRTPTAWVSQTLTELPGSLSVSTITPTDGCAAPTPRLATAVDATEGTELDLCATSWASHWVELANHTAALRKERRSFTLAATPLAGSVQVAIDGLATTDFSVVDRVVTVPSEVADGAEVLVRYADAGTCGASR